MPWTVIVPMNSLHRAKSRLVGASDSPQRHRALVTAMRADTVAAITGAGQRLVVVTADPGGDGTGGADDGGADPGAGAIVADPAEPGLNAALRHAGRYASRRWPADPVAVVVGDLPALTAEVLEAVLREADGHLVAGRPRAVVLDRQGTGTTMLLAAAGHELLPEFGVGSARRHIESGAVALPAPPAARCDVDVPADLDAARALGLGPHTRALFPA